MIEDQDSIVEYLSKVTPLMSFESALLYAITLVEGASVYSDINIVKVLEKLAEKDLRFKNGIPTNIQAIPNSKFNSNGNIYVGKEEMRRAKNRNEFALILYFRGGIV